MGFGGNLEGVYIKITDAIKVFRKVPVFGGGINCNHKLCF